MANIVCGGGWKDKREERLKVKAWGFLFVAIFGGAAGLVFLDDWDGVMWLNAGSLTCFMISLVLFFVERPRGVNVGGEPVGSDLYKLYGAVGSEPLKKRSAASGLEQTPEKDIR